MHKYDCESLQDRFELASCILSLLVDLGFSMEAASNLNQLAIVVPEMDWEFVASKYVGKNKRILVYTTIEKGAGAMRNNHNDKIKVVRQTLLDQKPHFKRVARIKKDASIAEISKRLEDGIIKACRQLNAIDSINSL